LLNQYAFEPFIHPGASTTNLVVVLVYDRRRLNEQPAFGAWLKNCQLHPLTVPAASNASRALTTSAAVAKGPVTTWQSIRTTSSRPVYFYLAPAFHAQNPNSDPLRKVQSPDPGFLCRLEVGWSGGSLRSAQEDEVAGSRIKDPGTIQILKDYMANGRF
jgi:hypothetical protein